MATYHYFLAYPAREQKRAEQFYDALVKYAGQNRVFMDTKAALTGSWPKKLPDIQKSTYATILCVFNEGPGYYDQSEYLIAISRMRSGKNHTLLPVYMDGEPEDADKLYGLPGLISVDLRSNKHKGILDSAARDVVERIEKEIVRYRTTSNSVQALKPGKIVARGKYPFVGRLRQLRRLDELLPPVGTQGVVVIQGQPGVGKSELALQYAREQQGRYPNGAYFILMGKIGIPMALASYGRRDLGLELTGFPIEDQCDFVLRNLVAPTLLIYDNVTDPDALLRWLPANDEATHILATTAWEDWQGWSSLEVPLLKEDEALEVVRKLGDDELAELHGQSLVEKAGGLLVQLCPLIRSFAKALRRGLETDVSTSPQTEAITSFSEVWSRLDSDSHVLLLAATFFDPTQIRKHPLEQSLCGVMGWSSGRFRRAIEGCMDLTLIQPGEDLRMHQLFQEFVRSISIERALDLQKVRSANALVLVQAARDVINDLSVRANLTCFSLEPDAWHSEGEPLVFQFADTCVLGEALSWIGVFDQARDWFQVATDMAQKRSDTKSLARSLHGIGACHCETGSYDKAEPYFRQIVDAAKSNPTDDGAYRKDVGRALHQVGICLFQTGKYEEALHWAERAIEQKEASSRSGDINHISLGRSQHLVGLCLSSIGQYGEAIAWFEKALASGEQAELAEDVDHSALAANLHQIGICQTRAKEYEIAKCYFEAAVDKAKLGDLYRRVDHICLATSIHQVGVCYSKTGDYEAARDRYELAFREAEQGDVYGRVDHETRARSLHQAGTCLSSMGDLTSAKKMYLRAVDEAKLGDVHGRVHHANLGLSLHQLGMTDFDCGDFTGACSWFELAVKESAKGDWHGVINNALIGRSQHQLGNCLFQDGQPASARRWFKTAIETKSLGDPWGNVDSQSVQISEQAFSLCNEQLSNSAG